MPRTCTLALDIGGTKIAHALIPDDAPDTTLGSGRVSTQGAGLSPLEQTRAALEAGLQEAARLNVQIQRVGMGAPGVVRAPAGEIIYNGDTITGWAGSDLRGLTQSIIDVPFAAHNDVRVWAYGEHLLGAGLRHALSGRVLYVSLGTGVGGAIIDEGQLLTGSTSTAGEFAEIICADHAGKAVRCENVASGTGLTRYYNSTADTNLTLHDIMKRWDAGEELARTIITGNLTGFGRTLGALTTLLDLAAVVVGGGVSGIGAPVLDPIREGISQTALVPNRGVHVLTTELGPDAAVIAAAQYARDHAF